MNAALVRTLIGLLPVCLLLSGSAVLFRSCKSLYPLLQLFGSGCLLVVIVTHICEALRLFPYMHWGEHSIGHYVDLASALLGITLFSVGYFLYCLFPK